jgi:hypothetical protein
MSFVRFNPEDFVISAESVTAPLWTGNTPVLNAFYTGSSVTSSFYLDVYNLTPGTSGSETQFSIAYGNYKGSGSILFNPLVTGSSPTRTTYGQYRNLIYGDENSFFNFGTGNTASLDAFVINVNRARYKESLMPGTFNLTLSGSSLGAPVSLKLTDDSNDSTVINFCDAGRIYNIVSGSNGSGLVSTTTAGVYGKFLPDVGLIVLNPSALALTSILGGMSLNISQSNNSSGNNNETLFNAIKLGAAFQMNSQETISSNYLFVRVKNGEFNYTTNPSFISGSGELVFPTLVNNPQTYMTTVGMYNDNNELLAVAKMSKPLVKDFTKEALIRVKLDF